MNNCLSGSTNQVELSREPFRQLLVRYPTCKSEQSRIGHVLSVADQAVRKTEALIAKSQRIKVGLMQDLFSYGIDEDGRLRSEKDHTFKDSSLGRIPAEWELARAKDVCSTITKGSTPRRRGYESTAYPIPFLRVQNLTFDGRIDIGQKCEFITRETHEHELARSAARFGDVLTNIVGPPLGKVAIVSDDYPEWNLNQAIALFRLNHRASSDFLCYWLQAPKAGRWFELNSKKTSGQQNLTLQHCQDLPLLLPSIAEQNRITTLIHAIDQVRTKEEACLLKLRLQRAGLMADLLTGIVCVEPLLTNEMAVARP